MTEQWKNIWPAIGTLWQNKSTPMQIIRIESGVFCSLTPAYAENPIGSGYWRTTPAYDGEPVIKFVNYGSQPKVIYRYLLTSLRSVDRIDKCTVGNASLITLYNTQIK